jgi:hypothetical protein
LFTFNCHLNESASLIAQENTDYHRVNMKWWTMRCLSNRLSYPFPLEATGRRFSEGKECHGFLLPFYSLALCKRFHSALWWPTMRWTALYSALLRWDHRIRSVLLKYLANKRKISAIFTELCIKVQQGWSRIWGTEMTSLVKLRIFHSTLAALSGDTWSNAKFHFELLRSCWEVPIDVNMIISLRSWSD